jgi:hypothetical protein
LSHRRLAVDRPGTRGPPPLNCSRKATFRPIQFKLVGGDGGVPCS